MTMTISFRNWMKCLIICVCSMCIVVNIKYGQQEIFDELNAENTLTAYNSLVLDHGKYNIVTMHGQLAEYKSKDKAETISIDDLKNKNIELEEDLLQKIKEVLTDLEEQVFTLMINGFKYKEIAEILDKDEKSIDNTMQRLKAKIRKVINN